MPSIVTNEVSRRLRRDVGGLFSAWLYSEIDATATKMSSFRLQLTANVIATCVGKWMHANLIDTQDAANKTLHYRIYKLLPNESVHISRRYLS